MPDETAISLTPDAFATLRIPRVVCVLNYPQRDLRSRMETLVDALLEPLQRTVREAGTLGAFKTEVSESGDLQVTFASRPLSFRIDIQRTLAAIVLEGVSDLRTALSVAKVYYASIVVPLGLRIVEAFAVDFANMLYLAPRGRASNIDLVLGRLVADPRGKEGLLSEVVPDTTKIRRADFQIGWEQSDRATVYLKLEFPANEKNMTFWPGLNLRSREDVELAATGESIGQLIDEAHTLYTTQYARMIARFLSDWQVVTSKM